MLGQRHSVKCVCCHPLHLPVCDISYQNRWQTVWTWGAWLLLLLFPDLFIPINCASLLFLPLQSQYFQLLWNIMVITTDSIILKMMVTATRAFRFLLIPICVTLVLLTYRTNKCPYIIVALGSYFSILLNVIGRLRKSQIVLFETCTYPLTWAGSTIQVVLAGPFTHFFFFFLENNCNFFFLFNALSQGLLVVVSFRWGLPA